MTEEIRQLLTVSETPNGDTHNMEFISDESHGWLKIPAAAYLLADAPASQFSYADRETVALSDFVYLEEDMDAPRFLQSVGITVRQDEYSPSQGDGTSDWYIPERNLFNQRRYNELSPRDMNPIHDPRYVNPFAAAQESGHLQIIDYRS